MSLPSAPNDRIDVELVARIRAGDVVAFEYVFRRYVPLLCEIAYRYVAVRDIAQELVQDVFLRIWENRGELAIQESLRVYLYAAVRHRAVNHLKHERVERRVVDTAPAAGEHPGMGGASISAEEELLNAERRQLIEMAIEDLPERQRMVFRLRWEHHLSYAEIGSIMGLSQKGVESARARAIQSLQKKLQGVLDS